MGQSRRKTDAHYTYGDYCDWPHDERWELINGTAWSMSPAPNRAHQKVLGELLTRFMSWLKDTPCQVYPAPFDVLFPANPNQADNEVDPWCSRISASSAIQNV